MNDWFYSVKAIPSVFLYFLICYWKQCCCELCAFIEKDDLIWCNMGHIQGRHKLLIKKISLQIKIPYNLKVIFKFIVLGGGILFFVEEISLCQKN